MTAEDEVEWKPDEASKARTAAALAQIDRDHSAWPECTLRSCRQRVARLDRFGLCSKTSVTHQRIRDRERNR